MIELQKLKAAAVAQQKALEALREESEELYQEAIQVSVNNADIQLTLNIGQFFIFYNCVLLFNFTMVLVVVDKFNMFFQPDPSVLPHSWRGPLNTPPIKGYEAPDGEYKDTTKDYMDQPLQTTVFNIKLQ